MKAERRSPKRRSQIASDPSELIGLGVWWTEADDAELDVLVHELVHGVFEHRPRCARCADGYPPCPHVREAIEAVLEWRAARALLSRAEWLRAERNRMEAAG